MGNQGDAALWAEATERIRTLVELATLETDVGTGVEDHLEHDDHLEHLVDQVSLWLAWEVLHADPTDPRFHRHNDLTSQWGGPNADNVYRHARISPGHTYRITGRMHSCDDFILAVRAGFMHEPVWGTLATITAGDLNLGPGDAFEIYLGAAPAGAQGADGGAPIVVPIPEGAVMASIREYYFEWEAEEPAFCVIECLDPENSAGQPETRPLAARIHAAIDQMEHSLSYWHRYLEDNRAERSDNTFADTTVSVAKGLSMARYEFCFWTLEPGEALIIEAEVPLARYWSAQLYRRGTFELVGPTLCITSRNHTQTRVDSDGKVRWVLAGEETGVANQLDTQGRRSGLCTVRWFWPIDPSDLEGDAQDGAAVDGAGDQRTAVGVANPKLTARVVPVDTVADLLPPDTATVTEAQRASELASRQAHLRWRFRV